MRVANKRSFIIGLLIVVCVTAYFYFFYTWTPFSELSAQEPYSIELLKGAKDPIQLTQSDKQKVCTLLASIQVGRKDNRYRELTGGSYYWFRLTDQKGDATLVGGGSGYILINDNGYHADPEIIEQIDMLWLDYLELYGMNTSF